MTHPDRAIEAAEEAAFGEMDDRGLFKDVGEDLFDEIKRDVTAAVIAAYEAQRAAEGLVVVPKDATDQMAVAGGIDCEGIIFGGAGNYPTIFDAMKKIYGTMIANRPLAAAQNGGE